jgi:hypothetical protein
MKNSAMTSKLRHSVPVARNRRSDPADQSPYADRQRALPDKLAKRSGSEPLPDSPRDSAEYIAVLASQLQRMAATDGHEFLAYLIDMVVIEAWRIAGPDADYRDKNATGTGNANQA